MRGKKEQLSKSSGQNLKKRFLDSYQLYILLLPALIFIIVFNYIPMYGVQIAFRDFRFAEGITGSEWVGLHFFQQFFNAPEFGRLLRNTLTLSIYELAVGFPLPIILALMFNEVRGLKFKRTVQMVTYAPHFVSTVVVVSMITLFLNRDMGLFNHIIELFGGDRIDFLARSEYFRTIYVFSGVWQGTGWAAIIFIAALSGVDPTLVEAGKIDGCGRFRKIWHIDLPSIAPTIVIMLILSVGSIMNVGFEKVLLMQNPLNMQVADVIQTYVYRLGLVGGQFSLTAAIGLFNSVVNVILLVIVNSICRKIGNVSLW